MAHALEELIGSVVEWMQKHPDTDEKQLIPSLVKSGEDESVALDLIVFVPLAFGRALMKRTGAKLKETYSIYTDSRHSKSYPLLDNPIYCEAYRMAEDHYQGKTRGMNYLAIAGRSPEVRVLNQALNKGSDPKNLVLGEPFMYRPQAKKPRWWDFWNWFR
jgi:hypothetical protein